MVIIIIIINVDIIENSFGELRRWMCVCDVLFMCICLCVIDAIGCGLLFDLLAHMCSCLCVCD